MARELAARRSGAPDSGATQWRHVARVDIRAAPPANTPQMKQSMASPRATASRTIPGEQRGWTEAVADTTGQVTGQAARTEGVRAGSVCLEQLLWKKLRRNKTAHVTCK